MGAPHRRDRWWAVAWPERDEASDRARAERIWTSVLRGLTPFGADVWPTCNANSNENYKGASATSGNGLTTIIRAEAGLPPAKWMERNLATNGWPTATASDAWGNDLNRNQVQPCTGRVLTGKAGLGLGQAARGETWPTPNHRDYKGSRGPGMADQVSLPREIEQGTRDNGSLNPSWVETLMGYPIGYTLPDGEPMLHLPGEWPAGLGAPQHDWEPPRLTTEKQHRAARLKALGNTIVPKCALLWLAAIQQEATA